MTAGQDTVRKGVSKGIERLIHRTQWAGHNQAGLLPNRESTDLVRQAQCGRTVDGRCHEGLHGLEPHSRTAQ